MLGWYRVGQHLLYIDLGWLCPGAVPESRLSWREEVDTGCVCVCVLVIGCIAARPVEAGEGLPEMK